MLSLTRRSGRKRASAVGQVTGKGLRYANNAERKCGIGRVVCVGLVTKVESGRKGSV